MPNPNEQMTDESGFYVFIEKWGKPDKECCYDAWLACAEWKDKELAKKDAALRKYGKHSDECAANVIVFDGCDCGLQDVLEGKADKENKCEN